MTITDDYKIFADKYHNKQHIPNDLIQYIMKMNTDIIKVEKETKQKFKDVINDFDAIYNSDYDKDCFTLKEIIEDPEGYCGDVIDSVLYIKVFTEIDNLELYKLQHDEWYEQTLRMEFFYYHFGTLSTELRRQLRSNSDFIEDFYKLYPEKFNDYYD